MIITYHISQYFLGKWKTNKTKVADVQFLNAARCCKQEEISNVQYTSAMFQIINFCTATQKSDVATCQCCRPWHH